ncbi:MAG: iron-containing alcohol dehydrogenase [Candidatus Latescibacteria bacterium]|nr:iron-containing alcohol dehydrogenase [Candidatus Latescibacterota bacterium]
MPFQSHFDFRCPTQLIHGPGSIARLAECFSADSRVLVVSDKGLVASGVVSQATAVLEEAGLGYALFEGVLGNPPARCVQAGYKLYQKESCTALLGLGGGSPMDVAKMIGVLAVHGGTINQYLGTDKVEGDLPPLVCVPTTYGTGSEVTPFAVLTNPKTNNKDAVISWKIAPRVGILDADLSVGLPPELGAATGMDALTHALESYTNLQATPLTEGIALQAIRLIGENIRLACANSHELEATDRMLVASALAGVAFAQTRLGNVHAMSHPLGARFGVHHGLANAVLLPHVMDFNLPARVDKFVVIARELGVDTNRLAPRQAAQKAVYAVRQLNADLGIAAHLGETGVKATAIGAMAKTAMLSANIAINPRLTRQEDIEAIYRAAM